VINLLTVMDIVGIVTPAVRASSDTRTLLRSATMRRTA